MRKKTSNLSSSAIKVCHRSGCPSLDLTYLFIFVSPPHPSPRINTHLMDFNECEKQKAAWCHILFATRGYVGYEEGGKKREVWGGEGVGVVVGGCCGEGVGEGDPKAPDPHARWI